MPIYKITDPSGKTVRIQGDRPPTQSEAKTLFSSSTLPTQDERLGIDTGFERFLAPVLRISRPMGENTRTRIQELQQGTGAAADIYRGIGSVQRGISEQPILRETSGAFMRGALQGEGVGTSSLFLEPKTLPGKAIQGAGFLTQAFNPYSALNKTVGYGIGAASRVAKPIISPIVRKIAPIAEVAGKTTKGIFGRAKEGIEAIPEVAQIGKQVGGVGEKISKGMSGIGRELIKLGATAKERLFNDAAEKGIDLYEESAKRGFLLNPKQSVSTIDASLSKTEEVLQKALAESSAVVSRDDVVNMVRENALKVAQNKGAAERAVATAEFRMNQLGIGKTISAPMQRILKIALDNIEYGVSAGDLVVKKGSKGAADFLRQSLKSAVPGAAELLREEETLIIMREYMEDLVRKAARTPQFLTKLSAATSVGGAMKGVGAITGITPAAVGQTMRQPQVARPILERTVGSISRGASPYLRVLGKMAKGPILNTAINEE